MQLHNNYYHCDTSSTLYHFSGCVTTFSLYPVTITFSHIKHLLRFTAQYFKLGLSQTTSCKKNLILLFTKYNNNLSHLVAPDADKFKTNRGTRFKFLNYIMHLITDVIKSELSQLDAKWSTCTSVLCEYFFQTLKAAE